MNIQAGIAHVYQVVAFVACLRRETENSANAILSLAASIEDYDPLLWLKQRG